MTAYERQPERRIKAGALLGAGLSAIGRYATRNPLAVGGTTAFLVALSFVSANALWYQPQPHPSAFVSTREQAVIVPVPQPAPEQREQDARSQNVRHVTPAPETGTRKPDLEATGSVPPSGGDETVRSVQNVLQELGLYDGPIDGMTGPQTHEAVENYRRIVDLPAGHEIDSALLQQLGLEQQDAEMPTPPAPTPAPRRSGGGESEVQTASLDAGSAMVRKVQAGLKAFGNDGIEVDGMLGENTRQAIREFQSLFGLPVTGKPDETFLAKMREVGLIN